ncbi:MAG TPA: flagellar biosynthesis protein FlhF [Lacipirellulaceae bacterium]|jgi:flagellar biosynthesis protein FlhF|nr:flagellar biosynthesis protein FlhF [Lacipirellulaceae bacterium]
MDIKTYRAKTMRDALELVRRELGPAASVLHTREVHGGPIGRLVFGRRYEVAASATANVPSRLPVEAAREAEPALDYVVNGESDVSFESDRFGVAADATEIDDYRARYRDDFRRQVAGQLDELHAMVEKLCDHAAATPTHDLPEAVFRVFTDLIDADVDESVAREWLDEIRREGDTRVLADPAYVKTRVVELLESEIKVSGPIMTEAGKCRVVALVGPTGVGKTTTIAKLAANYRLREKRRVGLITVDTYRVAAVEQLRTYADIIDLPMEVVATPREMREAVARMSHLDLVLMDTAGRSPRDEVRIQELKSMLSEAEADEVHLVLSSAAGAKSLVSTAQKFADVGTTSIVLTKLDEAHSLGHLVSLVRNCPLAVSYLTDGQNVPDDIQVAKREEMAERLLGIAG